MGDFFQHPLFATLHRLHRWPLVELEAKLAASPRRDQMALLLPSLASEMDGPALPRIVELLAGVDYIQRVVIALDRATEAEYRRALEFFSVLPQNPTVLWLDGPRGVSVFEDLERSGLGGRIRGKGQAVWFAMGHLLASGDCRWVATHDCDIVTYDRYLLARLCYPVLRPEVDFRFAKAYYPRVSDRLNGRVTRLYVYPVLSALRRFFPNQPFLHFLSVFRYPLAGEMAMDLDLVRHLRVPSDWGLEVGLLAEVYRNLSMKQICQVDVAGRYDHKHQDLSAGNPEGGLMKMVKDITGSIFRSMAAEGVRISRSLLLSLKSAYIRIAQDYIERYAHDSAINGFAYDRDREERAVEVFVQALELAGEAYLADPLYSPLLPNWNRVFSALPELSERLAEMPHLDRMAAGR
jgi:glucosyl-3-phosphoglycerate synthase